jgi:hypothetical protein
LASIVSKLWVELFATLYHPPRSNERKPKPQKSLYSCVFLLLRTTLKRASGACDAWCRIGRAW